MAKLCDIDFIDLYLRQGFAYFKGLAGQDTSITPVDEQFQAEIEEIRQLCQKTLDDTKRREFSFLRDDVLYRVAAFYNPHEGVTFVMRQKKHEVRPLSHTGLGSSTQEALLHPDLRGAVLVLGEMSAGKTSTISAAIEARLTAYGGLALVLEDPIETRLSGEIGKGLSLQIEVESYADELVRGMRSNADLFMIGEIRDGHTASEFLRGGSNGHLLLSSAHAQSIAHGLTRIRSLIGGAATDVNAIMSQSLALVIYQSIKRSPKANGEGVNCRLTSETLLITGAANESAIREKIYQGSFRALADEITAQKNAQRWAARD
ncbi:ATPase, T2SS/T4P/T4SS family [Castellaniella sp.]|uniref:ATPase, T2SS/T4P/T4SS family n=1 Tax=Castellaniella sp. TaxID=1955812 RepID=UPI002B0012D1|nr:ATPase, T2SS/T4P/T4SS family [Castellaniella sp.]